MNILNDSDCSWINDLSKRQNIKSIQKNLKCDYLIIGAGFTGLSAARQLSKLDSNLKIIIVDAQLAGEVQAQEILVIWLIRLLMMDLLQIKN